MFADDSVETVKARLEAARERGHTLLLLALSLDEMSIMSKLQFDGRQFRGEVDLGGLEVKDNGVLATNALVFMLVAVNQGWKIPMGYFLLHGLEGAEKANLVNLALTKYDVFKNV